MQDSQEWGHGDGMLNDQLGGQMCLESFCNAPESVSQLFRVKEVLSAPVRAHMFKPMRVPP